MSGFKPLLHRQMQQRRSNLLRHGPSASFNHVFTRKRNRVEFISDFPPGDSAGMIASLEVSLSFVSSFVEDWFMNILSFCRFTLKVGALPQETPQKMTILR